MLHRRLLRTAAPLIVGALALSACSKSDDDAGSDGGKKVYRIAYQGPLTGESSALGVHMENGVKLAIKQANARGDLPFTLSYVAGDDAGSADQSPAAAQKIIDDDKVIATIGPAFSAPTKAAGQLYSQAGLVALTPSASSPALTTLGFTSFLRGIPNDNAQGGGMAAYLAQKVKARKVFLVDDKTEYGVGLAGVAEADLKKAGVQVVHESVPQKTPDYTAVATAVRNSGADGLIYAGFYADAAPFAKKLKEAGFDKPKIASDGTNDRKFIDLAGDASEGWLLTCPCVDATVEPGIKKFTEDYRAEFKVDPGTYSAEAFDVTNLVIEQLRTLGTDATREALLDKVRHADYKGLTKRFRFDDKGEFPDRTAFLYRVESGRIAYQGNILTLAAS
ncbi:branched-chain amino acid ABC transporter substrate-binding protein [Kitasatospora sp. NPDC056138]|uniref:branched-chain amino acid ABC transporter substrate-binding protein n=1 Tax=Kitasatospora sp. NPDC056138 TaxID=3345724 RepID=UPI0035D67360